MYEDLLGFLDQSHYDIALIQETKLREDSEYTRPSGFVLGRFLLPTSMLGL